MTIDARERERLERLQRASAVILALTLFIPLRFRIPIVTVGSLLSIVPVFGILGSTLPRRLVRHALVVAVGSEFGALVWAMHYRGAVTSADSVRYLLLLPWLAVTSLAVVAGVARLGVRACITLAAAGGTVGEFWQRTAPGNLWKYDIGIWIAIGAIAATRERSWSRATAYGGLVGVSAIAQSRTIIVTALIAASAEFVLARKPRPISIGFSFRLVIGICVLLYGTLRLAFAGVFGGAVSTVMLEQAPSGNVSDLILSGRPEAWGNWKNFLAAPLGGHLGGHLSFEQAARLEYGFSLRNRDPSSNYVQQYLLSRQHPELHSIAADLWANLGVVALLLVSLLLALYVRGVYRSVVTGSCVGLMVFVSVRGIDDLAFSPLSDLRYAPIALGLVLYHLYVTGEDKESV